MTLRKTIATKNDVKKKVKWIIRLCCLIAISSGYLFASTQANDWFKQIKYFVADTWGIGNGLDYSESYDIDNIPVYKGKQYIVINNNKPYFKDDEITTTSSESYSELDYIGRCGPAMACLGKDTMPKESEYRGDISSVHPSGWRTIPLDDVDGGYLYNRCHLIAYCLSSENDNEENLITGTRSFNTEKGMEHFELEVQDYIYKTDNHVMYRVTPVYEGKNKIASGVLMEGYSVEDKGKGISYCVYVYNNEPGHKINYRNGKLIE